MLIIDGDYPMAFGAVDLNRDLTLPIEEARAAEPSWSSDDIWLDSGIMATLPELRKAQIAAALVKVGGRISRPGNPLKGYRTGEIAYAVAHGQLDYYRILEAQGEARLLKTKSEFSEHMRSWSQAEEHSDLPIGFVLGIEGADPILHPAQVHDWWGDGIRVVSLTHYAISTYAHGTGTGTEGGLIPPAKELLQEMESCGMILDLTHLSDASIRQAIEIFAGPLIASHQNCRALTPGERQFPDDILKSIIDRGGVIGSSMDTWMLYRPGLSDWSNIPSRRDVFPREAVTLEDFADHIDYVCQLAGNANHAAIGGDTDGQSGKDGAPFEIDTVADYQKLVEVLERRGYSSEDIENVMYRNWQRFYETWLMTDD